MSYSVEVNILCDADLSQTGVNRCYGYVGGEPMPTEAQAKASARAEALRAGWTVYGQGAAICAACRRVKQLRNGKEQEPAA